MEHARIEEFFFFFTWVINHFFPSWVQGRTPRDMPLLCARGGGAGIGGLTPNFHNKRGAECGGIN